MVYKRYIKRGGKTYGPYWYESHRVNGKVVAKYVGEAKNTKKRNYLMKLILPIKTNEKFSEEGYCQGSLIKWN